MSEALNIVVDFMPTKGGGIVPRGHREKFSISCVDGMAICSFINPEFTKKLIKLDNQGKFDVKSQKFISFYKGHKKEEVFKIMSRLVKEFTNAK